MKKLYLTLGTVGVVALTPFLANAQILDDAGEEGFTGVINSILTILDLVVVLILALALVFFLWGVALFILNAGDPEGQSKGKNIMFWGIIALFVMVAVWGLVGFLQDAIVGDRAIDAPGTLRGDPATEEEE